MINKGITNLLAKITCLTVFVAVLLTYSINLIQGTTSSTNSDSDDLRILEVVTHKSYIELGYLSDGHQPITEEQINSNEALAEKLSNRLPNLLEKVDGYIYEDELSTLSSKYKTGKVDYRYTTYSELTANSLNELKPNIIFFNDCSDNFYSNIYCEIHNEEIPQQLERPNITSEVANTVLSMAGNDCVVLFNKSKLNKKSMNNLDILFTMFNLGEVTATQYLKLSELFDKNKDFIDVLSLANCSNSSELKQQGMSMLNTVGTKATHTSINCKNMTESFLKGIITNTSILSAYNEVKSTNAKTLTIKSCIGFLLDNTFENDIKSEQLNILEIQPNNKFLSNNFWKIKLLNEKPLYDGKINVRHMGSNELSVYNDDLASNFDIAYIGSEDENGLVTLVDNRIYMNTSNCTYTTFKNLGITDDITSISLIDNSLDTTEIEILQSSDGVEYYRTPSNTYAENGTTYVLDGNTYRLDTNTKEDIDESSIVSKITIQVNKDGILLYNNKGVGYLSHIPLLINNKEYRLNILLNKTQFETDENNKEFKYTTVIDQDSDSLQFNVTDLIFDDTEYNKQAIGAEYTVETTHGKNLFKGKKVDTNTGNINLSFYRLNSADYCELAITQKLEYNGYMASNNSASNVIYKDNSGNTYTNEEPQSKVDTTYTKITNKIRVRVYALSMNYMHDKYVYKHIGDEVVVRNNSLNYSGITFIDDDIKDDCAYKEFTKTRKSGNDLTEKAYNNLVKFSREKLLLASNKVITSYDSKKNINAPSDTYITKLISDENISLYNETGISKYKFNNLLNKLSIESAPIEFRDYSSGHWGTTNDSGETGVKFDYAGSTGEKTFYSYAELGVNGEPTDEMKKSLFYTNPDKLSITFKLNNTAESTTEVVDKYSASLYLDKDTNGIFEDSEKIEISISDSDGNTGINSTDIEANKYYTIKFNINSEYKGIIPWKLEVGKYSYTSNFAVKATGKKELKILQILPSSGDTTLDLVTDTKFKEYISNIEDYNVIVMQAVDNKGSDNIPDIGDCDLNTKNAIPIKSCKYYYSKFNAIYKYNTGMTINDFDMILIGCGKDKVYLKSESLIKAIKQFKDQGKPIIFTNDVISYQNLYGEDKTAFNKYMRTYIGQDRFGVNARDGLAKFSLLGTPDNNTYLLKQLRSGVNATNAKNFALLMKEKSFDNLDNSLKGIEGLSNSFIDRISNKEISESFNKATVVNKSIVSEYPYHIGNSITTANEYPSCYQLNSYNEYLNVMYAFNHDAVNSSYLYNIDNIIYNGIGASDNITDDELKLLVNTIVMGYKYCLKRPYIEVLNTNINTYEDTTYVYVDSDISSPMDILDTQYNKDDCTLNLKVRVKNLQKEQNINNYIQLKLKDSDSTGGSYKSVPMNVVDTTTNSKLDTESNIKFAGVTDTDNLYRLNNNDTVSIKVNLQSLITKYSTSDNIELNTEESFIIPLEIVVFTSYNDGTTSTYLYSSHSIEVIKRELFDIK